MTGDPGSEGLPDKLPNDSDTPQEGLDRLVVAKSAVVHQGWAVVGGDDDGFGEELPRTSFDSNANGVTVEETEHSSVGDGGLWSKVVEDDVTLSVIAVPPLQGPAGHPVGFTVPFSNCSCCLSGASGSPVPLDDRDDGAGGRSVLEKELTSSEPLVGVSRRTYCGHRPRVFNCLTDAGKVVPSARSRSGTTLAEVSVLLTVLSGFLSSATSRGEVNSRRLQGELACPEGDGAVELDVALLVEAFGLGAGFPSDDQVGDQGTVLSESDIVGSEVEAGKAPRTSARARQGSRECLRGKIPSNTYIDRHTS